MPDRPDDSLAIIGRIQSYFADKGWQPLLPVKVNGLQSLSLDNLQNLLPKILSATDRMTAVEIIVEVIAPNNEPSPCDTPDTPDSVSLKLRPPQS